MIPKLLFVRSSENSDVRVIVVKVECTVVMMSVIRASETKFGTSSRQGCSQCPISSTSIALLLPHCFDSSSRNFNAVDGGGGGGGGGALTVGLAYAICFLASSTIMAAALSTSSVEVVGPTLKRRVPFAYSSGTSMATKTAEIPPVPVEWHAAPALAAT